EINAIVVALHVIESAAAPPAHPVVSAGVRFRLLLGEIGRRRREPRLDRFRTRRYGIADGDEATLLRVANAQRDRDQIAGLERRRVALAALQSIVAFERETVIH